MYIFEPLRTCTMYLSTHHGHLWTLVASNDLHFQKKMIFSCIKCIFFQLLLQYGIRYALRTSKRYIVRGFIRGQMDLQLRAWTFIKETPTWCTFLSLSFNVHYHGKLFGRHLWPLMASKNEKYHVLVFFFFKFFKFYFRHGLHIASGPQKGALFVGIIGGKMVLHWRP